MKRRLLLVPLVTGPIAGATAALWVTGLAWPIITTAAAVLMRRRPGDNDELDIVA